MKNLAQDFFASPRENSLVKATIVSKYFVTWASIIIEILKRQEHGHTVKQIAYVDLFSGPGTYEDGTPSTPVLVLQEALKSEDILERIHITFNDKDRNHAHSLRLTVDGFEGIDRFIYKPIVSNFDVTCQIRSWLRELPDMPTLLFLDAWGYKDLSVDVIESVLQKWGSGCILFFNFNRINAALDNPHTSKAIDHIFGQQRATRLRKMLEGSMPRERELTILEEFSLALKEASTDEIPRYVLPFRFKDGAGTRTSHHLIHVSRHFLGYDKMKEIMAKESSVQEQGVPSFEYNSATERQPFLMRLNRPLDELEGMLLRDFTGQSATVRKVHEEHSVDTPFTLKNYKVVLYDLWDKGKIAAHPHPKKKNTFADHIVATFPPTEDSVSP